MRHLLLGLTVLVGCAPTSVRDPLIVAGTEISTAAGPIAGTSLDGARTWKGIPYAAAPVGGNRFRPPQPVTGWTTPRDATAFGNVCAQASYQGGFAMGDEDCLFLNVFAPDPAPPRTLPVMVWIHGGAFLTGAGSEPLFDGAALVRARNVVMVTLNYRLGPLGFLAHPTLPEANVGLLDQRAALRWVTENIHAFGGDPGNVTLFGQSAGAWSVTLHLASAGSAGLFQRAIIQSGATPAVERIQTVAEAGLQAEALGAALGCSGEVVACLRERPVEDVVAGLTNTKSLGGGFFQGGGTQSLWLPVMDGAFLTDQPHALFAGGRVTSVPTMVGSNLVEGALFHAGLAGDKRVKDVASYEAVLELTFGEHAAEVEARYPATDASSANDALAQIDNDLIFLCPSRRVARGLTEAGAPVFRYHFTRPDDSGLLALLGATHSAEITYVLGNDDGVSGGVTQSQPLREQMQGYWTRFAATGDPNGDGATAWPRYDSASDPFLTLDLPAVAGTGLASEVCDFWDSLPPYVLPPTW